MTAVCSSCQTGDHRRCVVARGRGACSCPCKATALNNRGYWRHHMAMPAGEASADTEERRNRPHRATAT